MFNSFLWIISSVYTCITIFDDSRCVIKPQIRTFQYKSFPYQDCSIYKILARLQCFIPPLLHIPLSKMIFQNVFFIRHILLFTCICTSISRTCLNGFSTTNRFGVCFYLHVCKFFKCCFFTAYNWHLLLNKVNRMFKWAFTFMYMQR